MNEVEVIPGTDGTITIVQRESGEESLIVVTTEQIDLLCEWLKEAKEETTPF